MSGREAGREAHPAQAATDPDHLEVAEGSAREKLEGWVPELASPEDLRLALERAFDYRGDVKITSKNGDQVEGYVFDRVQGTGLESSFVRLLPKDGSGKLKISYADVSAMVFTGRDMAAGKCW